jgi:hypothetical protein
MRNRAAILFAVAGLLSGLLGVLPPTAVAAVAAASNAPGAAAPSTDGVFVFLNGTVALSPSNAWAVGLGGIEGTGFLHSQVLHWNGRQWASVTILSGVSLDGLNSVSATGPSDIWSVGLIGDNCLIEHSNGRTWATVPCPFQGLSSELFGVDARAKSDTWAVGSLDAGNIGTAAALSEHWNGHHWAQVTVPPVSGSGSIVQLNSVLDLGPANVLAVGDYFTPSNVEQPLAEHWNGHAWKRVSVPAFRTASFLQGIAGGTAAGVIVVGAVSSGGHDVPLIERWTGTRFVRVAQPVGSGDLNAVTVLSRTSAYAVGNTGSGKTLVEHYNGKRWALVPTPNPADGGYFASIALTGSFAVAVGAHGPLFNQRFLIEQGNGRTWRLTRD